MAARTERVARLEKMRGNVDNLIRSFSERIADAPIEKCAKPAACLRAARELRGILDRRIAAARGAAKARSVDAAVSVSW
jgi:hypothetical protein